MALSIAHLSFSSSGGAGTVASRLAEAQRVTGHDAWVHSLVSNSLWARPWQRPRHTLAAAADHYLLKNPSYPAPVSLLRDRLGSTLPTEVLKADVVHVHWPHGLVSHDVLKELSLSTRVVWTVHDMNAFTATCHYAIDCRCYLGPENPCLGVRPLFRGSATAHWSRKKTFLQEAPGISFVSPSAWLAGEAALSVILGGRDIEVIANPLPPSMPAMNEVPPWPEKDSLGAGTLFVTSASELADPLKNIASVVTAFEEAFATDSSARLVIVGRGTVTSSHPGVRAVGRLSQQELWSVLAVADYFVVASLAENQPLAVSEAQAMGVSLLARDTTGLPEHLDIDTDGALFSDVSSLATLLQDKAGGTRTPGSRRKLSLAARKKFDPAMAAARYEGVYVADS